MLSYMDGSFQAPDIILSDAVQARTYTHLALIASQKPNGGSWRGRKITVGLAHRAKALAILGLVHVMHVTRIAHFRQPGDPVADGPSDHMDVLPPKGYIRRGNGQVEAARHASPCFEVPSTTPQTGYVNVEDVSAGQGRI
jgi:hypothetical protein